MLIWCICCDTNAVIPVNIPVIKKQSWNHIHGSANFTLRKISALWNIRIIYFQSHFAVSWVTARKPQDFFCGRFFFFTEKEWRIFTSEENICVSGAGCHIKPKFSLPNSPDIFFFFLNFPSRAPQWQIPAVSLNTEFLGWGWPPPEGHPKVGWPRPAGSSLLHELGAAPKIQLKVTDPTSHLFSWIWYSQLNPFFSLQNSSVALTHLMGLIAWKVTARPWTRWY